MKINLQMDVEKCDRWNYETHTAERTCDGCTCMKKGNLSSNVIFGVKIGIDRYCTVYKEEIPVTVDVVSDDKE